MAANGFGLFVPPPQPESIGTKQQAISSPKAAILQRRRAFKLAEMVGEVSWFMVVGIYFPAAGAAARAGVLSA